MSAASQATATRGGDGVGADFLERDACTVCGSRDLRTVYSRPYAHGDIRNHFRRYYSLDQRGLADEYDRAVGDAEFILQECRRCHAITQRFAPGDGLAALLYGKWIDEDPGRAHKRQPGFEEYTHYIQEALIITSFLLRHRRKSAPSELKVLDYGTGWGRFAQALKACGCEVYAFDLSDERREAAARNGLIPVTEDEIARLALDFINTEQVLEHVVSPLETSRLLTSGLASGGVLKVSVPFARWLETADPPQIDWSMTRSGSEPGRRRGSPMPVFPLEHLTYFKRPSLDVLADMLGLRPVALRLSDEFNFAFDWRSVRSIARNLTRPFVRDRIRNYRLFKRAGAGRA